MLNLTKKPKTIFLFNLYNFRPLSIEVQYELLVCKVDLCQTFAGFLTARAKLLNRSLISKTILLGEVGCTVQIYTMNSARKSKSESHSLGAEI